MGELQGGQKVRVLLAQALFGNPEALLLDEPTNHLDLDSIHWLRGFPRPLRRHADRHLARPPLPEQRLHAHRRHRLRDDHHLHRRLRRHGAGEDADPRRASRAENEQREKKIAQLNEFIARFSAGTRSSQVTSRKKEVERLQTTELARSNIQRPLHPVRHEAPVGQARRSSSKASTKALRRPAGHQRTSAASSIRGEKIVPDRPQRRGQDDAAEGAARRTRPTCVETDLSTSTRGTVQVGPRGRDRLLPAGPHRTRSPRALTAVEWLHQLRSRRPRKEDIRGLLGQMLFSGEEGLKPTEALSGGEAARLLFCRLMLQKPNVLVLDEPTNHLDLESHQRAEHRAAEVRGHGAPRHPRPGPDRRSRHAHLALRRQRSKTSRARTRSIWRLRQRCASHRC